MFCSSSGKPDLLDATFVAASRSRHKGGTGSAGGRMDERALPVGGGSPKRGANLRRDRIPGDMPTSAHTPSLPIKEASVLRERRRKSRASNGDFTCRQFRLDNLYGTVASSKHLGKRPCRLQHIHQVLDGQHRINGIPTGITVECGKSLFRIGVNR